MSDIFCYDPGLYHPSAQERQEAAETIAVTILDGRPLARVAALWGVAFFVAEVTLREPLAAFRLSPGEWYQRAGER